MSGRLPDSVAGEFPDGYTEDAVCYWRYESVWILSLPPGGVTGNLSRHDVVEHEDGTITVSPSVLITGGASKVHRHGFLRRGVWEPCGDDQPVERSC